MSGGSASVVERWTGNPGANPGHIGLPLFYISVGSSKHHYMGGPWHTPQRRLHYTGGP